MAAGETAEEPRAIAVSDHPINSTPWHPTADARDPRSFTLPACLITTVAIEAALVAGLAQPLWLFGPRGLITTPEPLATALGISAGGLTRFGVTLLVWLLGYAAALHLSQERMTAGTRRLMVLAPVLFAATLLFVLPSSSKDVYHYVMEGRVFAVHGDNPTVVTPAAYSDDRLYWILSSWETTPSRYGPVHNLLAGAVAWLSGGSLTVMLLGFKLVAISALFGTATLAWLTLRQVRPEAAFPAFVLVAWNPLALYEAAANGHNDLLMIGFAALALFFASRRWWELALPALALGVLTKYTVVLLGPVLLIVALRSRAASNPPRRPVNHDGGPAQAARGRSGPPDGGGQDTLPRSAPDRAALPSIVRYVARRLPVGDHQRHPPAAALLAGVLVSLALTVTLYLPFWDGVRTFEALRSASEDMLNSPGWLLRQALKHRFGWEGARPLAAAILTGLFLGGYALTLAWCWWRSGRRSAVEDRDRATPAAAGTAWTDAVDLLDQPTSESTCSDPEERRAGRAAVDLVDALAGPSFAVMLLLVCTLSWWLWPWYALWLLPAAALLTGRRQATLTVVITASALAAYIPLNFRELFWGPRSTDHMPLFTVLTLFGPPLIAAAWLWWRRGGRAAVVVAPPAGGPAGDDGVQAGPPRSTDRPPTAAGTERASD